MSSAVLLKETCHRFKNILLKFVRKPTAGQGRRFSICLFVVVGVYTTVLNFKSTLVDSIYPPILIFQTVGARRLQS